MAYNSIDFEKNNTVTLHVIWCNDLWFSIMTVNQWQSIPNKRWSCSLSWVDSAYTSVSTEETVVGDATRWLKWVSERWNLKMEAATSAAVWSLCREGHLGCLSCIQPLQSTAAHIKVMNAIRISQSQCVICDITACNRTTQREKKINKEKCLH